MDHDPTRTLATFLEEDDGEPRQRYAGAVIERHLLESRTLLVFGTITDRLAQKCAERALVMENQDPEEPITVLINSPGGSADSGFAIYDILRFVRSPVRTIVNGLCASAGILVHLAAKPGQRFTLPQSRFMIHQPSTAGQGTASDLHITARQVIKLRERYVSIISEATKRDPEAVLEDARRDFWLDAVEAHEYGIVDAVIRDRSELDS